LQFSEFGFQELLFVIFLYLLTVLNTLSTVIDGIIPFGSIGRQNFQDIINFPVKSFRVGRGGKNKVSRVTVNYRRF
jgi:hypothetical protein